MKSPRGYTLLEIILVLTLLSLAALMAVPSFVRGRDTLAVRSARADIASAIAIARSAAILNGGSRVTIDADSARVTVHTSAGDTVRNTTGLRALYGVNLQSDRGSPVVLHFDALGIGRVNNVTLRVTRGSQIAQLIISSYGRVRL